jgi:hypothetical protein
VDHCQVGLKYSLALAKKTSRIRIVPKTIRGL